MLRLKLFVFLGLFLKVAMALPPGVKTKKIATTHKLKKGCVTEECKRDQKLAINVIHFDLKKLNPIVFSSVPPFPKKGKGVKGEAISETAFDFFKRGQLDIAINANFFHPCCLPVPDFKDLKGLVVSNGKIISPPVRKSSRGVGSHSFIIHFDQSMDILNIKDIKDLKKIKTAVSGSHIIVKDQKVVPIKGAFSTTRHPRTVIGLDKSRRRLFLVTFDGRQKGYSSGATFKEAANWLIKLGVSKALNLDGGGSSALVLNGELINRPIGLRSQREVMSSIAVYSKD